MKQKDIITALSHLGNLMLSLGNKKKWNNSLLNINEEMYNDFGTLINSQISYNGWFTKENVSQSIIANANFLNEIELKKWVSNYSYTHRPKNIAIIMAGNIPLVGFHDLLCVLVSGNKAICKLSSNDKTLIPSFINYLFDLLPELKNRIEFTSGTIKKIDAVIATGSDNSLSFFKEYFGKYPYIFRSNRTSVAIIEGSETIDEINKLGHDIFDYFGLGCRNVSHIFFPKGYSLKSFFEGIVGHRNVIYNNKYANNYDYNKAIFLMSKEKLYDNDFVLLRESNELFSPLSMIHYQFYRSKEEVEKYIKDHENKIQIVISRSHINFGMSQYPKIDDYADGVDVFKWLNDLK